MAKRDGIAMCMGIVAAGAFCTELRVEAALSRKHLSIHKNMKIRGRELDFKSNFLPLTISKVLASTKVLFSKNLLFNVIDNGVISYVESNTSNMVPSNSTTNGSQTEIFSSSTISDGDVCPEERDNSDESSDSEGSVESDDEWCEPYPEEDYQIDENEPEEPTHCSLCIMMRNGPCPMTFRRWVRCTELASEREESEKVGHRCSKIFMELYKCMNDNPEYFKVDKNTQEETEAEEPPITD